MSGVIVVLVEARRRQRWPVFLVAVAHCIHSVHYDDRTRASQSQCQIQDKLEAVNLLML